MEDNTQGRKWQLTINNPAEHGITRDTLIGLLQTLGNRAYFCLCDECGENGTYHFHVFIFRPSALKFSQLKQLFPTAHIERCIGSCQENRAYVLKDGDKYNKDENGFYEYITSKGQTKKGQNFGNFFENTELPDEKAASKNNASRVVEMIQIGATDEEIVEQVPSTYRDLDKIQRLRSTYRDKHFRSTWRDLEITYIFGKTGSGKTRGVMEQYGYENVYRVTDYSHPFDTYEGQDVIIFEEFRSNIKCGDMLNYLDGYPLLLPSRYYNRQACYTKVYLISNWSPNLQYNSMRDEDKEAFFRRMTKIIEYVSSDMQLEYPSYNEYLYSQRYGKLP